MTSTSSWTSTATATWTWTENFDVRSASPDVRPTSFDLASTCLDQVQVAVAVHVHDPDHVQVDVDVQKFAVYRVSSGLEEAASWLYDAANRKDAPRFAYFIVASCLYREG